MSLDLTHYDFLGHGKSKIRQAARKIDREGYSIQEFTAGEIDQQAIESLSAKWRSHKAVRREVRFLTRPAVFDDEPDVRKFYLVAPGGKIVSFVSFDPICRQGEVIGYSTSVKRRLNEAPTGVEEAVTKFAIERFQQEGKATLALGLLPLYQIEDREFRHNTRLKRFFQWLYRYGNGRLYSFSGHADFKHRFRGGLQKMYVASRREINVLPLLALMRLCRIF